MNSIRFNFSKKKIHIRSLKLVTYWVLFLQLVSCNLKHSSEPVSEPVASIGDAVLLESDLEERIPKGLSQEDSVRFAQSTVARWMRDQLWIQQAKNRLSSVDSDIEEEVETYRNSLLIYRYQQQVLKQRLDTTVLESDILDYYKKNEDLFLLDDPIVQATFVKLVTTSPDIDKIKEMVQSDTQEDLLKLEAYCYRYASRFDNFNEEWVRLSPILSRFPNTFNIEKTIKKNGGWHDSSDSLYYRCLFIKKIRLKNQKAPLNFVRDRIENLILNNRKQELVKTIEYELHEEARNNGSYKLYN